MWQTIYPNSYITNEASQIDTFTIKKGQVQGPNTPLTPFHRNKRGDFWTCASSRSTRTFNYIYADAQGTAANVRNAVNRLYGPNAKATAGSSRKAKRDEEAEGGSTDTSTEETATDTSALASASASSFSDSADSSDPVTGLLDDIITTVPTLPTSLTTANNGSTYQYITNIQTTRFKLDGTYTVFMFLGDPDAEDPVSWSTAENMVGSYGVFSAPGMTGSDLVTTSTVPLTDALASIVSAKTKLDGPLLETLEQAVVVPFLVSNLHWRVSKSDGTVVDPEDVPNFKVSVVSSTMTQPDDEDEFPTWSDFNVLTQVTRGKKGGVTELGQMSNLGRRDHLLVGVVDEEAAPDVEE